jgi:hypothetical protein
MAYRPERGWGFSGSGAETGPSVSATEIEDLRRRVADLEKNRTNVGG